VAWAVSGAWRFSSPHYIAAELELGLLLLERRIIGWNGQKCGGQADSIRDLLRMRSTSKLLLFGTVEVLSGMCNTIHTIFGTSAIMSKRINIMIEEDTWGFLAKVPAGERSRAINEALRAWVTRKRRKDAVKEMDTLRTAVPKVSSEEVARWIREDREQGH
jgi:predicted CopG family antitoxin